MSKTLGYYRNLSEILFGVESKATTYLNEKIAEQGEDEEVIADESQMFYLLNQLALGDAKHNLADE